MNEITITFDRVFDIVRGSRRNRVPCTVFGFQSGDVEERSVAVPGSPRIEAGMTVTAVLERPGDWQTLLGWVNHETGEIACRPAGSNFGGIGAVVLGGLWAYHLVGTNHPLAAALVVVVSLAGFLGSIVAMRKAAGARRLLEAARATLAPRGAG
ncbi:hypothetical protein [Variovorax sp. YR216]|uniref:hypothetical protein n=1 Tax=Variovorax sp. YR216 TaxID=1882828 RepID=UPI000899EAFD|nr:hypothetical protein [Variovorax sp. YR216]SEB13473.1 hypothetical protein SAMN05444680_1098 [Variovorax sp. YR216]